MKISVEAKSFAEAIAWATKNVDGNDTQAYVALVLPGGSTGSLFHGNATSYMKKDFSVQEGEPAEEVKLPLDARFLKNIGGLLAKQEGEVTLTFDAKKNTPLKIKNDRLDLTVPTLKKTIMDAPEVIALGEIDDMEFFGSLTRLAKLCDPANEGVLPVIGAVDVQLFPEDEKITMMATDRYALGEVTVSFTPTPEATAYAEENSNLLLPAANALMVPATKQGGTVSTLVHEPKGKKIGYQFADGRVALFALKDATPLEYKPLKTKGNNSKTNSVLVEVSAFKNVLQALASVVPSEDQVFLDFAQDHVTVHDEHSSNTMRLEVEAAELKQNYTVGFMRSVLNEAFIPLTTSKVRVFWADDPKMFVFEPVLDDGTRDENVFIFVVAR